MSYHPQAFNGISILAISEFYFLRWIFLAFMLNFPVEAISDVFKSKVHFSRTFCLRSSASSFRSNREAIPF